jgi:hypothetical protein
MLPFRLFYNSAQDFAILNVICSDVWIITAPALYRQTPFMFASYFYYLSNPAIFYSIYTFILNRKTSLKDI